MTTNDFAAACLEGRDVLNPIPCIVRLSAHFSKRTCAASIRCAPSAADSSSPNKRVPPCSLLWSADFYLEAATAVTQIIEHLGQKEYWGNMLDVLPALLDISEFKEIAEHLSTTQIIQARMRTLTAKPLPGFLISEEHMDAVSPLLQRIFDAEVEGKRVEDILNGK